MVNFKSNTRTSRISRPRTDMKTEPTQPEPTSQHAGGEMSAAISCSVRPVPSPLYPCHLCYEDYTWPADDLHWCEVVMGWVCRECWDDESHGDEMGESLSYRQCRNSQTPVKCKCEDGSTGWTEIKCCNTCGLPHSDESIPWYFPSPNAKGQPHLPAQTDD